jgi:hypothetical protein
VYENANAAALFPRALNHCRDLIAVAEGHVAAGALDDELLREILKQPLRVGREQVLKSRDAIELALVRHHAGSIHRRPELEADANERVDGATRCGIACADGAEARPPAAEVVLRSLRLRQFRTRPRSNGGYASRGPALEATCRGRRNRANLCSPSPGLAACARPRCTSCPWHSTPRSTPAVGLPKAETRVCLKADKDQLQEEIALLRAEIRLKDARMACLPALRRPHYPPAERLEILELRAARGWSLERRPMRFSSLRLPSDPG